MRQSNLELLRIVAMTMIVFGHFLLHGINMLSFAPDQYRLLYPFFASGVNLFFMISGYFTIRLTAKSLFRFVTTIFLFSIVNILFLKVFGISVPFSVIVNTILFPISKSPYWFIQIYFLLMICSPLINAGLHNLTKDELRKFLILFTAVTLYSCGIGHNMSNPNGCTFLQALYMYCVAFYIKQDFHRFSEISTKTYIFILLLILLISSIGFYYTKIQSLTSYNSLLNIAESIVIFMLFTKLHFVNKTVNVISAASLGVYLLQDGVFGNGYLYKLNHDVFKNNNLVTAILLFFLIYILFWVGSVIATQLIGKINIYVYNKISRIVKQFLPY